ncbi:DUF6171 family protein [Clostridium oryzae]|uniref:Uncharacterized protein n=1 Tax=Clostridium oryzae TaxID=1450648 RepID=A0A1V4INA1_9CLOT|nr:DUF6171 family protein [Clostridium oryzae]OPJ61329.1 hypothetical protein CLORY_23690 [Clostridium oryzae]
MRKVDNCKACSASVNVPQKDIDKALEDLKRIKKIKLADDETYIDRLKICSSCQCLEYNTTCNQCGCIVQIKAKVKDSRCPYPKNSKW